jgi:hypothetical protein
MYLIQIFQVVYLLEIGENREKILDEHQKPKRTRTVKPMVSAKMNERLELGSDMLSRRIEMQLTRDLWEKHMPKKLFLVSNIMKHPGSLILVSCGNVEDMRLISFFISFSMSGRWSGLWVLA